MKIIPYGKQTIDRNDIEEVLKTLNGDWLTQGPRIKKFEQILAKTCRAKYAVAVSSGTAALHLACLAAGLKKGDEVITSPLTFLASANAVLYAQAKPVFADIDFKSANIDPKEIEKKITKRTKALLPVHYSGQPCDLKEIQRIAKKHRLMVIEDAAHALGAKYRLNKKSSTWFKVGSCRHSDMAVFSFHPVKSITTGEGGAILTNNRRLFEELSILRNHGMTKDKAKFKNKNAKTQGPWYYEMVSLGFNYRITDIQCALGISQMKKLNKFIRRRREIAKIYQKAFKDNPFFTCLWEEPTNFSAWHLFPICLKKNTRNQRKGVFLKLQKKGIRVQVHYIPVYHQPFYEKLGYKKGLCPNAEAYYRGLMSIPMYPSLTNKEIQYVIKTIKEVVSK